MLSAPLLFALAYVGNALIKTDEGTGLVLAAQIVTSAELLPAYDSEGKEMKKAGKLFDKGMSANKIRKKLGKAEGKILKARYKLQKMEFKVPVWCDVDDDEDRRRKSDKDNVFKLMDANVTRGQMKNLVTDRPSPITVKLAMGSDTHQMAPAYPGAAPGPVAHSAPALVSAELVTLAQEIGKAAERVDRAMGKSALYSTFIVAMAEELTKNVAATYEEAKAMLKKKFQKRWKKMGPTELLNELLEQAKAHDAVNERIKKLRKAVKSGMCDQ